MRGPGPTQSCLSLGQSPGTCISPRGPGVPRDSDKEVMDVLQDSVQVQFPLMGTGGNLGHTAPS